VVIDNNKNIYITGGFNEVAYFGSNDSVVSKGSRDIFVAKYDSTGTLLWLNSAGGKDYDNAMNIRLDQNNNVYIAGNFTDTSYFDGNAIVSDLYINNYIVKYSSSGALLWLKHIPADTRANNLFITTTDDGFFYSGAFYSQIIFGTDTLVADGDTDIFIAKFDEAGNYQRAFSIGGTSTDKLKDIELKDNNLFITCEFDEQITLNDTIFYSYGNSDVFTAKLDFLGNIIWATHQAGFYVDKAKAMALDKDGNVFVSGDFDDIIYFGQDSLVTTGVNDVFVAKYDNNGEYQWSHHLGSVFNEYAYTLLTSQLGDVYLSGTFKGEMTDGINQIVTDNFETDMFIAKYNTLGNLQWLSQSGGKNTDFANKIVSDPNNYMYIIGGFGENFAFEIDTLNTDSIINANEDDIFIARFFDCDNADVLLLASDTTFCGYGELTANNGFRKYEWSTGRKNRNINISQTGNYWLKAIDRHNCPVITDTMAITVYEKPEPVLGDDLFLQPGQIVELNAGTFSKYLWSSDYVDSLATTQTLIISTDSLYYSNSFTLQVENEYNCTGQTDIDLIIEAPSYSMGNPNQQNGTIINNYRTQIPVNNNLNNQLLNNSNSETNNPTTQLSTTKSVCYPNPSHGTFTINLSGVELEEGTYLEIFTAEGKKVFEQNNVEYSTINITLTSKGMHYVRITSGENTYIEEIVLQ